MQIVPDPQFSSYFASFSLYETSKTNFFVRHDHAPLNAPNAGTIAFNIELMRWEYTPYGQPVHTLGTFNECVQGAMDHYLQSASPSTTPVQPQSHPYHYAHVTTENLPPRLHITQNNLGFRAHFKPLTPGTGNTQLPDHYSPYCDTAELALKVHLSEYIEDLVQYESFQALLGLSQRFDGQAVIDAFERLKNLNPDEDYYLDAEKGVAPSVGSL